MVTQFCSRSSPATSVCDLQSPHYPSAALGGARLPPRRIVHIEKRAEDAAKLESLSMAKLKTSLATTACAVFLMGFANLAGSNILELAPIGSGYDFVVHVRSVPTYGYNPDVPTDAAALGLRLARQHCRGARVVGQRVVNHEIYGITSEKPDYLVFVRCAGTTSQ
jgi:hypothetical protein